MSEETLHDRVADARRCGRSRRSVVSEIHDVNLDTSEARYYQTLCSSVYDMTDLADEDRRVVMDLAEARQRGASWTALDQMWAGPTGRLDPETHPPGCPTYMICQDIAIRQGIAEGRVAEPEHGVPTAWLEEDPW